MLEFLFYFFCEMPFNFDDDDDCYLNQTDDNKMSKMFKISADGIKRNFSRVNKLKTLFN